MGAGRKPMREVRNASGILEGYQPTVRFVEVPYPSYADWLGLVWPVGGRIQPAPQGAVRRPSQSSILASTAWESFDAYQAATGNSQCPTGKAWLAPGDDDRLTFITGAMGARIEDVRRARRRR